MELHVEKVGFWSRDLLPINELYNEAFPSEEQLPMPVLLSMAKRKSVDYLAFYDEKTLAGTVFMVYGEKMVYIIYLAVNAKVRSRGYGSAILDWITAANPGKQLVLEIETVQSSFENYEQRVRRRDFYFKNGFHDSAVRGIENDVIYDILCTEGDFDAEGFLAMMKAFSFGFSKYRLEPVETPSSI